MTINEWIMELISIFHNETNAIFDEYDSKDFSGNFSQNTDFIMAQITYFANGLEKGFLAIEEVKKIGLKSL